MAASRPNKESTHEALCSVCRDRARTDPAPGSLRTGSLYVANRGSGDVVRTVNGVMSAFTSGLSTPQEIAFDAAGRLYIVNYGNGQGVSSVVR